MCYITYIPITVNLVTIPLDSVTAVKGQVRLWPSAVSKLHLLYFLRKHYLQGFNFCNMLCIDCTWLCSCKVMQTRRIRNAQL